jgi:hypothetical protein
MTHLIAIGWLYVVMMMTLAEGTSAQGSWLGAAFTFLLYGALPLSIVLYIFRSRQRRQYRAASSEKTPIEQEINEPTP